VRLLREALPDGCSDDGAFFVSAAILSSLKGATMLVSLYFLVFLSVVLGILFALGFVYAAKTNQFKDIEEPKYQMLREPD
jgi:nitrogen fixation-related uncharacterized protein